MITNDDFRKSFDSLIQSNDLIIDRCKGSIHPKYTNFIYPLDYGYLEDTTSMDGSGIDVWLGSSENGFDAIMIIVDTLKKDSEVKLLVNCDEDEKQIVYDFQNSSEYMKAILIRR